MLVRGIYCEGWRPHVESPRERKLEEFLEHVAVELHDAGPVNVEQATRAVFGVLARHLSAGEIEEAKQALPSKIRQLWPAG
jgi:uncharacterized protein (DUF2267 family)